jgi:uncharacterized protein (DUF1015 family)
VEIKPFRYLLPDLKKIEKHESFFNKLKENYTLQASKKIFHPVKEAGIIVYRIRTQEREFQGLLAGVNLEEYLTGNIKKHENTLLTQEENMIALTLERNAIIKPVLLCYPPEDEIVNFIHHQIHEREPNLSVHFPKSEQTHDFYSVHEEADIHRIQKLFEKKVPSAYIADGHHRMAAISHIVESRPNLLEKGLDHIMCAFFSFDQLSILPYNRVVDLEKLIDPDELVKMFESFGKIKEIDEHREPAKAHEIILLLGDRTFRFRWHKKVIQQAEHKNGIAFDIDLFNDYILHRTLDIHDVRRDPRIKYIEGIKGIRQVSKQVDQNSHLMGVCFYPVHHKDFKKTADHGKILPPKSTWFEPRIRNGLVVQEFPA